MASSSRGQIRDVYAEIFCERILSCANDVCSEDNTGLGCEEINMLVVLQMNREFMESMRLLIPLSVPITLVQTLLCVSTET